MFFSDFAPFGMLDFSDDESEGEKVYNALVAGLTDPRDGRTSIDLTPDPENYEEGKIYAIAMAIAASNVTMRRAHAQLRGETSYELLTAHEDRYSIVPPPKATIGSRRATLAVREKLARGPRREAVEEALRAILGTAFVAYRPITTEEALSVPADPGAGPGLFPNAAIPARTVRILDPVTGTSGATPFVKTVSYENWNPLDPEVLLRVGDELSVQPESNALAEKVTISAVAGTGADRTFSASFMHAHDERCSATTGPMPLWDSTKRSVLIVVESVAALDVELVRQVDEFMMRASRAPTQWAIVQPSTPAASTMGPFTLGASPLGAVPVGTLPIARPEPPVIGGMLPSTLTTAGGSSTLVGRRLHDATDVKVDGVSVPFTVRDDFQIDVDVPATFPAAAFGPSAKYDVVVVTPRGTDTLVDGLEVLPAPLVVASITPDTGPPGPSVVVGTGFLALTDITQNGFSVSTPWTVVDDTLITGFEADLIGTPGPYFFVFHDSYGRTFNAPFNFTG